MPKFHEKRNCYYYVQNPTVRKMMEFKPVPRAVNIVLVTRTHVMRLTLYGENEGKDSC